MNRKLVGLIILLVGSEVFGIICGNLFFGLFIETVPPAVITTFNRGTAHAAFVSYGLAVGFFIFVWALVAVLGSRLFRKRAPSPAAV